MHLQSIIRAAQNVIVAVVVLSSLLLLPACSSPQDEVDASVNTPESTHAEQEGFLDPDKTLSFDQAVELLAMDMPEAYTYLMGHGWDEPIIMHGQIFGLTTDAAAYFLVLGVSGSEATNAKVNAALANDIDTLLTLDYPVSSLGFQSDTQQISVYDYLNQLGATLIDGFHYLYQTESGFATNEYIYTLCEIDGKNYIVEYFYCAMNDDEAPYTFYSAAVIGPQGWTSAGYSSADEQFQLEFDALDSFTEVSEVYQISSIEDLKDFSFQK